MSAQQERTGALLARHLQKATSLNPIHFIRCCVWEEGAMTG
ncbi:MAG: hypothetical protein RLZZ631_1528 [Cyanobacteriota bacterium]